ncbi:hypothetical protein [Pengzhenrongella sp.]|jgi:hypothetical protein|uniref:hypothetical protein n=1 Tax=Pengzhenrongella sp. TaxID=2888820 RepID=UPI002F92062D
MHLDCRGTGSPTVVFESGLDVNGSLAWDAVHDAIDTTTGACAYDRAGIMWSDPKDSPQSAVAVAEDLHATLAAAGESLPGVLEGGDAMDATLQEAGTFTVGTVGTVRDGRTTAKTTAK